MSIGYRLLAASRETNPKIAKMFVDQAKRDLRALSPGREFGQPGTGTLALEIGHLDDHPQKRGRNGA
jgi:hypothetical protein